MADVEAKATTYANAIDDLAGGNAAVIADAGLTSRGELPKVTTVAKVTGIKSEQGKQSREAIVRWPEVQGAGAYALRVNFTPSDPSKAVDLPTSTSRKRTIVAPTPGAEFLVWVAAIGAEGPGDYSDAASCTAR
jgi:hypothetical protein